MINKSLLNPAFSVQVVLVVKVSGTIGCRRRDAWLRNQKCACVLCLLGIERGVTEKSAPILLSGGSAELKPVVKNNCKHTSSLERCTNPDDVCCFAAA